MNSCFEVSIDPEKLLLKKKKKTCLISPSISTTYPYAHTPRTKKVAAVLLKTLPTHTQDQLTLRVRFHSSSNPQSLPHSRCLRTVTK
jgi:hypothetical protein